MVIACEGGGDSSLREHVSVNTGSCDMWNIFSVYPSIISSDRSIFLYITIVMLRTITIFIFSPSCGASLSFPSKPKTPLTSHLVTKAPNMLTSSTIFVSFSKALLPITLFSDFAHLPIRC